jgi:Zn-dependent peptidase ImmA (M78 family)
MLLDLGEIEGRASYIRKKLGLSSLPERGYSTRAITEGVFSRVFITGDNLPRGVTEMVVRDRGRYQLFYSRKVQAPSQRLGIIHGCYHTLTDLREDDGIRKCDLTDRKFRQVNPDPVELACDLFAGALLVPFSDLDHLAPDDLFPGQPGSAERHVFDDEVDVLASRFQVPAGFMRWRLYDLAKLRQTHFFIR